MAMQTRPQYLTDPYGLEIHGLEVHCGADEEADRLPRFDRYRAAIERPALIMVLGTPERRFYLRALGWDHMLLLQVDSEAGRWTVRDCMVNPAAEVLNALVREGQLLVPGDYNL